MESSLKRSVMRWLKRQPDVHAVKLLGGPGTAGEPDIFLSVGRAALWVELKTASGRLSPLQRVTLARIQATGAEVVVARSLADVQAAVENLRS